MAKKKKKQYAPTEQELALPQEYLTIKAGPLKERSGLLLDRLAGLTSNWTIAASIVSLILLFAPVMYGLISMMVVACNFLIAIMMVVFTVGVILLSVPFMDMIPTAVLLKTNFIEVIYSQVLPVATIATLVLSILSTFLLFARVKTSKVWRIVVSILIFLIYLLVLVLYYSGVITYAV